MKTYTDKLRSAMDIIKIDKEGTEAKLEKLREQKRDAVNNLTNLKRHRTKLLRETTDSPDIVCPTCGMFGKSPCINTRNGSKLSKHHERRDNLARRKVQTSLKEKENSLTVMELNQQIGEGVAYLCSLGEREAIYKAIFDEIVHDIGDLKRELYVVHMEISSGAIETYRVVRTVNMATFHVGQIVTEKFVNTAPSYGIHVDASARSSEPTNECIGVLYAR